MRLCQTIRTATLLAACSLSTAAALAQHGPGGGPPGGGSRGGMRPEQNIGGHNSSPSTPSITTSQNTHSGVQLGPPGRWWDDTGTARTLNLRSDQKKKMDSIFETNKGQLMTLYNNFQREQSKLNGLSSADLQDENKVFAAIDRVTVARSELEKAKVRIFMQIRSEMDSNQRAALDRASREGLALR